MPQQKKTTKKKRRPKQSKMQRLVNKWIPYVIVGLFAYTLYTTQFFHFFSQSQREAQENHLTQESEISLIFSFSTPQDVMDVMMNLQKYFTQIMTNIDLNQMYSFIHDGFAFGGNIRGREEIRQHPTEYRFARNSIRQDNLRYDEEQLTQNPHIMPLSDEPLIYIFNSHPTEMIGTTERLAHIEGDMNVIDMSHLMANHFEAYGLTTLVEERCLQTLMADRGMGRRWYDASRVFLEETINQYDSLRFFFDVHRDAIPRNLATITVGDVPYARVMLVIGSDNPNHLENRQMADRIHDMLEEQVPGISRGVRLQGGFGVDGIYNQDVSPNLQLFEIGSYQTTVEEAENSLRVLSSVIAEYIKTYGLD